MKKKSVLSLMVMIAILATFITVPVFADSIPTFRIEGKVVLPGNDVAPDGNLYLTLEYRSDNGTIGPEDDFIASSVIVMMKGSHEASFQWDLPFTGSTNAKFVLGYSLSSTSQYWHKGYYALKGMQYYNEGQMQFHEGGVSGLVITPLKASKISGTVALPAYTITQSAVEVDVSAKTTGISDSVHDDFEAVTKVYITSSTTYELKVPTTVTTASYIVMYNTKSADYEKQGWYNITGNAIEAADASKVDVSDGNRNKINLVLIKKTLPDPEQPDLEFDLNGNGCVDVKDQVLVARSMGSVKKYVEAYDLNKDGVINVIDLKLIKAEIQNEKNHWKMGKNSSCNKKVK